MRHASAGPDEAARLFRRIGELERRALLRADRPRALDLAGLEELDAAFLEAPDARSRLEADRGWHRLLLPARRIGAGARRELERLHALAAPYQEAVWRDAPRVADMAPVEEHRAVVDALSGHRLGAAGRLLEAHWRAAAERARRAVGTTGNGGREGDQAAA